MEFSVLDVRNVPWCRLYLRVFIYIEFNVSWSVSLFYILLLLYSVRIHTTKFWQKCTTLQSPWYNVLQSNINTMMLFRWQTKHLRLFMLSLLGILQYLLIPIQEDFYRFLFPNIAIIIYFFLHFIFILCYFTGELGHLKWTYTTHTFDVCNIIFHMHRNCMNKRKHLRKVIKRCMNLCQKNVLFSIARGLWKHNNNNNNQKKMCNLILRDTKSSLKRISIFLGHFHFFHFQRKIKWKSFRKWKETHFIFTYPLYAYLHFHFDFRFCFTQKTEDGKNDSNKNLCRMNFICFISTLIFQYSVLW